MSDDCSRNGCERDATWWVLRRIDGHRYSVPVCDGHKSDLSPPDIEDFQAEVDRVTKHYSGVGENE